MAKTMVLQVPDMTCGHCELSVQEALDELNGVQSTKADHRTGDVEVAYDDSRVGAEQFREAIEEAGYTLRS